MSHPTASTPATDDGASFRLRPIIGAGAAAIDGDSIADLQAVFDAVPEHIPHSRDNRSPRQGNLVRASFAYAAVEAYSRRTGTYDCESARTSLSDLLNDIRHLCDALGMDFDDVSRPYHYDEEVQGG